MTQQKQLKARVRERMAKTGESYMVARRHILNHTPASAYQLRGGIHPETAAVANAFANRGILNPDTGEPIDEALILAIGGGLGAGYILWEFDEAERRVVTTGFRNQWQYPQKWFAKICQRLGIDADVQETSGVKKAATLLDAALEAGYPAITSISAADLPYWHLPTDQSGWMGYPIVVYGRDDEGRYLVDDRNAAPLAVDPEALAASRGRISSYKHRLLVADAAATEPGDETVVAAVRAGLDDHVEHLSASSSSFSIPAFAKWSKMMVTDKAKGWPVVFADGGGLLGALVSSFEAVDEVGMLGGNLRPLFANALDAAGSLLEQDLGAAAAAYRATADAWAGFGAIVLAVPEVAAVVAADRERREAVARGDAGRDDAAAAGARSADLLAAGTLDLSERERGDLFHAMGEALAAATTAEQDALTTLRTTLAR